MTESSVLTETQGWNPKFKMGGAWDTELRTRTR